MSIAGGGRRDPPYWRRYLRFWGPDPSADIEDELSFHLEARVAELTGRGTSEPGAREQAQLEFGDVERVRGELRAIGRARQRRARRARILGEGMTDVRLGLRTLRRNPAYAASLLATLALVIGTATTVFSLVNGVLLRPLPYPEPGALVVAWEHNRPRQRLENVVSVPMYEAWRERSRAFAALAALVPDRQTLSEDSPEQIYGGAVTASWFDVVGVRPHLGRGFTEAEARAGGVVVLSHDLWRNRFAADPRVLGATLRLTGDAHTVVGVMPEGFEPPAFGWLEPGQTYWVPFGPDEDNRQWGRFLLVLGRLAPGATVERAHRELERVVRDRQRTDDPVLSEWSARLVPLHSQVTGEVEGPLLVLAVAVAFLALIGIVNVTNLVLARAQRRDLEFAVRASLGAGRWRIVRQLAAEAVAVTVIAAPIGVLVALLGVHGLALVLPPDVPRSASVRVDRAALAVSIAVTIAATIAIGLAPILRVSAARMHDRLRADSARVVAGAGGRPLIVVEIALAFVLAVGAGLALRSYAALSAVPLGFDPDDVVAFRVSLPTASYQSDDSRRAFYERLLERVRSLPGIEGAGAIDIRPLRGGGQATTTWAVGTQRSESSPIADVRVVTPDYFTTLRIGRRAGHGLESAAGGPHAASVNETLARQLFPGRQLPAVIGERFVLSLNTPDTMVIAGIVADVRVAGPEVALRPTVYRPFANDPPGSMDLVVRAALPGDAVAALARRAVAELDRTLPIYEVATLRQLVAGQTARQRVELALLAAFSLLALLLAATGIYGVLAMEVGTRTREIAVRIALGAAPRRVRIAVVRSALAVTLLGLAFGLLGAIALTRFMASLLFGIEPTDRLTYAAVVAALLAVALTAAWLPARRASTVEPMEAIRAE